MLPLLPLALGGLGVAGVGGGIAQAIAGNKYAKYNKDQLAKLQKGPKGLSAKQEDLLQTRLMSPVQTAAAQARSRAEQIQASSGAGASGADLSRLRTEQTKTLADSAQNAALQIAAADEAKKQATKQEIEQRMALQSQIRKDNIGAIFGGLSQTAGAAGAIAAQPKLENLFATTYAPDEMSALADFAKSNPEEFARQMQLALARAGASGAMSSAGAAIAGGM